MPQDIGLADKIIDKIRANYEIHGYNNYDMELPKLQKPEKYVGLYIFDFGSAELAAGGDHAGVGFTAEEVAELLESEKYKDCKVYKIHKAYPDGRLELKGVPAQTFQLEAGMFFYSADLETANRDFKRLISLAVQTAPPCRAKVHLARLKPQRTQRAQRKNFADNFSMPRQQVKQGHLGGGLAKYNDDKFAVALIYPAECDDEVSLWLLEGEYKTAGAAEGGTGTVQRYYDQKPQILERHQLFGKYAFESRTGEQLLAGIKLAVQR